MLIDKSSRLDWRVTIGNDTEMTRSIHRLCSRATAHHHARAQPETQRESTTEPRVPIGNVADCAYPKTFCPSPPARLAALGVARHRDEPTAAHAAYGAAPAAASEVANYDPDTQPNGYVLRPGPPAWH